MSEPKYDEDIVNLGYLKKVISDTEENIDDIYKNVSRHYASKPQPPYNKGDTWIDGDIVYVCINSRQIGLYTDSDWVTESGAREEVKNKNKTYLKQPSNYSPGDMWILQSDNDHKAGKKGEILISTAGRAEYDEGDWINMLGYGTIRSINEVADNLNNAINRIGNVEEAIEDGIIITFYQDSEPEGKHIGDLWYVTGEIEGYTKGKIYRYDGTSWVILDDPAIQKAFDEANEARIVADGKIQSFYSATEPTQNVGVGDLWIDIDNNNQLYRYNGTKWVAVYDTRINELVVNVETVTERVATIETDLGEIDLRVSETTTTITTIQGDVNDIQDNIVSLQSQIDGSIQFWNGSDIPTVSNYPASDWTTEEEKNKHRADIYTVIEDVDGELKQGKSYRFDKVGDTWQWIELTDNELSAVQALAQSKAKVFVTTPKVPYSIGDLWLNNGKLYECQVSKDASGSYSSTDWKEAVNYTDDTVANLAKTLANNAQSTADSAVEGVSNITNTTGQAEGKNIYIKDSAEEPLVDISLHGESIQEGEPTPDNPIEIENVEGKNLFSLKAEDFINGETLGSAKKCTLILKPNTSYTLSSNDIEGNSTATNIWFNGNSSFLNGVYNNAPKTVTTDETGSLFIAIRTDKIEYLLQTYWIQLEEGTVATPYAPYNSLEVKVEGKNLFSGFVKGIAIDSTNGNESVKNTNATSNYIPVDFNKNPNYYLSGLKNSLFSFVAAYNSNKEFLGRTSAGGREVLQIDEYHFTSGTAQGTGDIAYIRITQYEISGTTTGNIDEVDNLQIQLEEGSTPTDYEPYKFQTAYFPLAEGQKLMEGSYLSDDGVHNKRSQVVLNGTESWANWNFTDDNYIGAILNNYPSNYNNSKGTDIRGICDYFKVKVNGSIIEENIGLRQLGDYHNIYLCIEKSRLDTQDLAGIKSWLAVNKPILEYELAEEEIVPFTKEQQKAWNKIKTLTTYKNITNITLDAYAKIVYARDNGLDIYETKQDAENKYIETTEKFAEQKITIDGIKSEVSSTQTTVGNYYKELTGKFDDYAPKSDIVSIQKSVTTLQTDTYTKTEINTKLIDGSVEKVLTTAGTFDENGLTIEKTNAKTKGNFNEKGITVTDATSGSSQELLFAGYDEELNETIVRSKNMTVEKYFVESNIARREEYSNPVLRGKGIGVFIL